MGAGWTVPGRLVAWHSGGVLVTRIGYTALKGARHLARPALHLGPEGPDGDRVLCLVDVASGRVLRTVENPNLLQTSVRWQDGVLTATLPGTSIEGVPTPTGDARTFHYWGRRVALELVEGPWAAAYSAHLGYDVARARARAGEVVYGASVSLITSGSLDELARRLGSPVADAQLRATFTVGTDGPHHEDAWIGRRLALGDAEIEVRGPIPRCRVIDLDPHTGAVRADVLRALAGYRRRPGGAMFGVDAVVIRPGRVLVGDRVSAGGATHRTTDTQRRPPPAQN